jgi:hypothetical protein
LSKERVGERSSEDFNDSLKVNVAQRNSKRPLLPLAMRAATSPGTRRGEETVGEKMSRESTNRAASSGASADIGGAPPVSVKEVDG